MEIIKDGVCLILTVVYFAAAVFLLLRWKGQLDRGLLIFASFFTSLWLFSLFLFDEPNTRIVSKFLHLSHMFLWLGLLLRLLHAKHRSYNQRVFVIGVIFLAVCAASMIGIFSLLQDSEEQFLGLVAATHKLFPSVLIFISLAGLYVVWRVNRLRNLERRANVRVICLMVSFILAYNFIYGAQIIITGLSPQWHSLLLLALYSMSAILLVKSTLQRNQRWVENVYISRDAVMYIAGMAMVAMVAYSLMMFFRGIDGGGRLDYAFAYLLIAVFCAAILVAFFSTRARAHTHVFLSKHFFNYRYDYREEWLRLIRTLSKGGAGAHMLERVIQSIAQIVGSRGGMLWVNRHGETYDPVARWGEFTNVEQSELSDGGLVRFLEERQWVIERNEYIHEPELYEGLELPEWILKSDQIWLIVPLMQDVRLLGFVALPQSSVRRSINWEDRDLIKTAGRQAATHIAQMLATQALMESREFDAFNRLSAFVVHDIKNVVGQLALITNNAQKHRDNPEFVDDVFTTVESASRRGERLLAQLRDRSPRAAVQTKVDLIELLREVISERSAYLPKPDLMLQKNAVTVMADAKQLKEVISHLVENAQQATDKSGSVELKLDSANHYAVIDVVDNGCGMDAEFIRERLFRPFDSTKGNEGMGIGVYQSREIIRSLRGSLDVESSPGEGSKFTLRLPIVDE